MAVQSLQQCLNFHLVLRLFPKDGEFGVYFKIGTGGDVRTAEIIGWYALQITYLTKAVRDICKLRDLAYFGEFAKLDENLSLNLENAS